MSLSSHKDELARKHVDLDRVIKAEEARPGSDATAVKVLKLKKLRLKEEIAAIKTPH